MPESYNGLSEDESAGAPSIPSNRTPETDAEVEKIWEEASALLDRNNVPGAPQGPELTAFSIELALDLLPLTEEEPNLTVVLRVEPHDDAHVVPVKMQCRGLNKPSDLAELLEDMAKVLRESTPEPRIEPTVDDLLAAAKAAHPAGGGFNPEPV